MGYDEFGQRVRMVQGNGVQTVMRFQERTRRLKDIDADHRDLQLVQQGKPARPFQRLRYQYDRVGNIKVLEKQAPYDQQMNGSVLVLALVASGSACTRSWDCDDADCKEGRCVRTVLAGQACGEWIRCAENCRDNLCYSDSSPEFCVDEVPPEQPL